MSETGEIYTAGKNFTLPPALTGWTNSNSAIIQQMMFICRWAFILIGAILRLRGIAKLPTRYLHLMLMLMLA